MDGLEIPDRQEFARLIPQASMRLMVLMHLALLVGPLWVGPVMFVVLPPGSPAASTDALMPLEGLCGIGIVIVGLPIALRVSRRMMSPDTVARAMGGDWGSMRVAQEALQVIASLPEGSPRLVAVATTCYRHAMLLPLAVLEGGALLSLAGLALWRQRGGELTAAAIGLHLLPVIALMVYGWVFRPRREFVAERLWRSLRAGAGG